MSGREGLQALWGQPRHPTDFEVWLPWAGYAWRAQEPGGWGGKGLLCLVTELTFRWAPWKSFSLESSEMTNLGYVVWNVALWTVGWGWKGCLTLFLYLASGAAALSLPVNFPMALLQTWGDSVGEHVQAGSWCCHQALVQEACCCGPCPWSPRLHALSFLLSLCPPGLPPNLLLPLTPLICGRKLHAHIYVGGKFQAQANNTTLQLFSIILGVSPLRNIFLGVNLEKEFQLAESYFMAS